MMWVVCTLCSLPSESEELLSQISTAQFTHLSVTSDLSQLAVTTHMNHVLLVNLSDYFEVVYVHVHVHWLCHYGYMYVIHWLYNRWGIVMRCSKSTCIYSRHCCCTSCCHINHASVTVFSWMCIHIHVAPHYLNSCSAWQYICDVTHTAICTCIWIH